MAFREERRERSISMREKHHRVASIPGPGTVHTRTGVRTCNVGMCPDWELNPQPFGYGMTLQPTELHRHWPYALCFTEVLHNLV